jgi:glycosyltransferase involved in cell wall biosynthesis
VKNTRFPQLTSDARTGRIGVVLKGYPRLSETFIAQEIRELERLGFNLEIISLRHPTDKVIHPVHAEIEAPVHYLPEYLYQEPLRILRAWWKARKLPGYRAARQTFLKDFRRDMTPNRIRRFGQGLVIAAEYAPELSFLYVHFIHTPASAARYGAIMAGLAYAISAHAKDIWTTPGWELAEKLASAKWCVTCTKGGAEELGRHAAERDKIHLVYHGIDLSRFSEHVSHVSRNGSNPADPFRILTVGRAVAKKGIDTLLSALAILPDDLHWRWQQIGGGPLRDELRLQAERLGISDRCNLVGALAQEDVIAAYRQSDLFVLPCRIDDTGDRDGLPNVLLEAQSQALAVLTTPVSGIPELVTDGVNGVFVDPDDPSRLALALARLARDPHFRLALGVNGERIVRSGFDHHATIAVLQNLLAGSLEHVDAGQAAA